MFLESLFRMCESINHRWILFCLQTPLAMHVNINRMILRLLYCMKLTELDIYWHNHQWTNEMLYVGIASKIYKKKMNLTIVFIQTMTDFLMATRKDCFNTITITWNVHEKKQTSLLNMMSYRLFAKFIKYKLNNVIWFEFNENCSRALFFMVEEITPKNRNENGSVSLNIQRISLIINYLILG